MSNPNKHQKWTLKGLSGSILLMILFPPFELVHRGSVINEGYAFILSPPSRGDYVASVDVSLLLTQFLLVLVAGGLIYFLAGAANPKKGAARKYPASSAGIAGVEDVSDGRLLVFVAAQVLKTIALGVLYILRFGRAFLLLIAGWQFLSLFGLIGVATGEIPAGGEVLAFFVMKIGAGLLAIGAYLLVGWLIIKLHSRLFPKRDPILRRSYSV